MIYDARIFYKYPLDLELEGDFLEAQKNLRDERSRSELGF